VLFYQYGFTGGDLESVGNVEYRIPIVGPVSMSFFFDAGVVGVLQRDQLRLDPSGLADLRSQFPRAQISDNLPLAVGSNFQPRASTGIEFVVQLPIVQVPFRIYYAYNVLRYSEVLQQPRGSLGLSDAAIASLCSSGSPTCAASVLSGQIIPQVNAAFDANSRRLVYSEALRTIRFTVSRTF
jgi:outer membrane protein insertion porin family